MNDVINNNQKEQGKFKSFLKKLNFFNMLNSIQDDSVNKKDVYISLVLFYFIIAVSVSFMGKFGLAPEFGSVEFTVLAATMTTIYCLVVSAISSMAIQFLYKDKIVPFRYALKLSIIANTLLIISMMVAPFTYVFIVDDTVSAYLFSLAFIVVAYSLFIHKSVSAYLKERHRREVSSVKSGVSDFGFGEEEEDEDDIIEVKIFNKEYNITYLAHAFKIILINFIFVAPLFMASV